MSRAKMGIWEYVINGRDPGDPVNPVNFDDAFLEMLGFSDPKDYPNTFAKWSALLPPDHAAKNAQAFVNCVNDPSGATVYDVEYQVTGGNGETNWFRSQGTMERDENGVCQRFVGVLKTIDEQRKHNGETEFKDWQLELYGQK